MGRQVIQENEPIWRALGDPTRRQLLDLLREGPQTTGALVGHFPTSRYTIMGHLEVLHAVGLITFERRGRERLNHLNPVPLFAAWHRWIEPFSAEAASVLVGLAAHAEEEEKTVSALSIDIRAEHRIARPPQRTWDALMRLGDWWPKCWEDDERLAFEPRLGGRLAVVPAADAGPEPAGTLWGMVEQFHPPQRLVLKGAMGLPGPVTGVWQLTLRAEGDATAAVLTHQAIGPVSRENRDCFARGWQTMLQALAAQAENGED